MSWRTSGSRSAGSSTSPTADRFRSTRSRAESSSAVRPVLARLAHPRPAKVAAGAITPPGNPGFVRRNAPGDRTARYTTRQPSSSQPWPGHGVAAAIPSRWRPWASTSSTLRLKSSRTCPSVCTPHVQMSTCWFSSTKEIISRASPAWVWSRSGSTPQPRRGRSTGQAARGVGDCRPGPSAQAPGRRA